MKHLSTDEDREFLDQCESCRVPLPDFNHRAHLRLAYVYLVDHDSEAAAGLMGDTLCNLLAHNDIDLSKFHQTLTRAWILGVWHFMSETTEAGSFGSFIEQNPVMLDSRIMMSHYSAELLFSDEAREKFVEPDRAPIPRHEER